MKQTTVFLLLLLLPIGTYAKHIVGGVMSYKYLGKDPNNASYNMYEMTLKVYLDQWAVTNTGAPDLDDPAYFEIYNNGQKVYPSGKSVALTIKTPIINPTYPCLTPPDNIAVTEGVYIWQETLPVSAFSYIVEYQRCCRNATITNIVNPANTGATFSIEITPTAQLDGDSSPEFKTFPPTLICVNEPLSYDHSASDIDGDQIVYAFCAPVTGGGSQGGNMPSASCNSGRPNPPCPPPFPPVVFKIPNYTADAPIPGLSIDPNTGLITGIPRALGQFVVGVCATEYRNGVMLSVLKRDFQFNVVLCTPTVFAQIQADTTLAGKQFLLASCGQNNILINNTSYDRSNVNSFYWDFNIKGTHVKYTDWNPTVSFPDTGVYTGILRLNPETQCSDSANITINIFNKPLADFSFRYDTCVAGPVSFTDRSSSPAGNIVQWKWDFGDGSDTSAQNPSHLYATTGTKNIDLHVVDAKNCSADTTRSIVWAPAPALLIIKPSTFNGCAPSSVYFDNLSKPIDSTYKVTWTFGDGGTGSAISPTYMYKNPGIYSVSINITTPLGCSVSANYPEWIRVKPGTVADFDFSPQHPTVLTPTIQFTDRSTNATQWHWTFGAKGVSALEDPTYVYKDTGTYKITLIAGNEFGCYDSISKLLDFAPQVSYFLPNAFTPNDDGINDLFKGKGIFTGMADFKLQIWNRWGELIFETTDPNVGWNGQKFNTSGQSPEGVYLCIVGYTGPRGEKIQLRSYATLIK